MARFGTIKYGGGASGGKYGTSPTTANQLWTFIVAWDGTYSGDNEGTRMVDFSLVRGRDKYLSDSGIEHYLPGRVIAVFDNSDRRFDPWNTSSPLYPNVKPGKFVRCEIKNGSTGTNYSLMRGVIQDIQLFRQNGIERARIVVADALEWLRNKTVNVEKKESYTWGECIEFILDAAGIPAAEWAYTSNHSGNVIPFFWASEDNALETIHQLEDAETGVLRHRSDGAIFWSSRTQAAGSPTTVTEAEILRDISIPAPWENVVNEVIVKVDGLTSHNITDTIWALEAVPLVFAANETKTLKVSFRHPTLNISIVGDNTEAFVTPPGNYAATANSVAYDPLDPVYTMNISLANYGTEGILVINNPRDAPAYMWILNIIGDAVYAQYEMSIVSSDVASIAADGKKTMTIETPFMQREAIAQIIAPGLVTNLKTPIPLPTIQVENRPALQYAPDLYISAIRLQLASRGLDQTYRVGRIEHKWLKENGQAVVTTFGLEPNLSW